jgi:hypothetical protein
LAAGIVLATRCIQSRRNAAMSLTGPGMRYKFKTGTIHLSARIAYAMHAGFVLFVQVCLAQAECAALRKSMIV